MLNPVSPPTRTTRQSFSGAMVTFKLVLTAIFWGGTFIAARVISREADPFSAAFLRFVVASLCLLGFVVRAHGSLPLPGRSQLPRVVLLGLTGVFSYNYFFFSGLQTITAGRASLIIAANPAFIALFSAVFLQERLTLLNGLGVLLSVCGAAVVVSRGDLSAIAAGDLGRGEWFIFGCVASWVAYSLMGKAAMKELSPPAVVTHACVIGALFLFPAAVNEGMIQSFSGYSLSVWLGIAYLGLFGSALGFVWYYEGIFAIGPSRAGVFINLVPVSAILMASIILEEAVDGSLAVGSLFVVIGVYLTNRSRPA